MVTQQHPWSRYVALGDSFTEGIGDPEPTVPGGHRGWADRVAEVLAQGTEDFAYANLAVRGKLIQQIIDEQVEPALALRPDLITISAGGNDVIRPRHRPRRDRGAVRVRDRAALPRPRDDRASSPASTSASRPCSAASAARSRSTTRTCARSPRSTTASSPTSGRSPSIQDQRMWSPDRLHLNSLGHHTVARMVLDALNVENDLEPMKPEPLPARAPGGRRASRTLAGRASTSCRGCCGASATSRRATSSRAKRPDAGPYRVARVADVARRRLRAGSPRLRRGATTCPGRRSRHPARAAR